MADRGSNDSDHDMVSYGLAPRKDVWRKYELLKNIKKIIDELNYSVDFTIVEGIHDEKALRLLGYNGPIIKLCGSGLTISGLIDEISTKFQGGRAAILVDFDKEGKQLNQRLIMKLNAKGIKINQNIRKRLENLIGLEGIYTIEGINALKKFMNKEFTYLDIEI
jgi:5S rRNA maturation endonuclease (ribonuclease M5)